jgi:hypothetical protein
LWRLQRFLRLLTGLFGGTHGQKSMGRGSRSCPIKSQTQAHVYVFHSSIELNRLLKSNDLT